MTEKQPDGTDRIRQAEDAGFPSEDLDALLTEAEERFLANVEKHGVGKNWLRDEARWHIWKACDELFQARDYANDGREDPARSHMADALNHMLFALEITRNDREVIQGISELD